MPIVFVHGVSNRPGDEWDQACAARESLLRRFALPRLLARAGDAHIAQPMWGSSGAWPRWEHASLPSGEYEALAMDDPDPPAAQALVNASLLSADVPEDEAYLAHRLREAAAETRADNDRQPLEDVVDGLWELACAEASEHELGQLTDFAAAGIDYARNNPRPAWSLETDDDVELVNRLLEELEGWTENRPRTIAEVEPQIEALGFSEAYDRLIEAGGRLSGVGGRLAGRGLVALARGSAHRAAAVFLGDVLVYLNERGTADSPGPIVEIVGDAIAEAQARRHPQSDPELIVLAHSLGGEIVYDLLTHFRPHLDVDTLVTVGSQVAFFEELKQFKESRDDIPVDITVDRASPPPVKRWINVLDRNDMLGFATERVFSGVSDFVYSTGEGALNAHGAYFLLPSFHSRLAQRLERVP